MERSDTIDPNGMLGVGDVAKRCGVAVSALHFYESKGLIRSVRSEGNQRRYPRGVVRRVALIKVAQRVGIPLAEVARAFELLPQDRRPTAEDWQRLSGQWRAALDQRIARLQRMRDQLDTCIGCGCLSLAECPLRNPGDVLGAEGPGARLLDPQP